jgi:hypothetical protein
MLGMPAISLLIQGAIFIHRWKKLLQQERSGELPNMHDIRNITPRQLILFLIGFPLLVASYVLFQFDYKLTGGLCLISYLVLWGIETVYVRRRFKKINEGMSIT